MGPKRLLSPEQERAVAQFYVDGASINQVAKHFNMPRASVGRTLARLGVMTRIETLRPRVEDDQREAIVACSQSGLTADDVAAKFNISSMTVQRILKEFEASPGKGGYGRRRSGYTLDESVFDTITPISARWMGFLFADGCLPKDNPIYSQALSMNIGIKDQAHVEKIRSFFVSNHAITDIHNKARTIAGRVTPAGRAVFYKVRSDRLTNALIDRGMIKDKGPDRTPVAELEDIPAFWAGAVDGDGWIGNTLTENDHLYAHLGLCGFMPLLLKFQTFLRKHHIANTNIIPTSSGIWKIQISGSAALDTIALLYNSDSESAGLDRKVLRSKQILKGEPVVGYEEPIEAVVE